MNDPVRVGIVGCGFIADVHSWALWAVRKAKLFDVRVAAVCDADHGRAKKLAEPNEAEVLQIDELLRAVDVVYVCTPTAEHLALVKAAAERKLPVFCEKPLAPDLRTANRVGAWLDRVPHQVGLVMRSSPVFEVMRDEIASGAYGRPMAVTMRDDQYFPNQGQYGSDWRARVDVAGGGTLIEHSIHDVDLFRWLLGDPGEVTCRTSSFFGHPGVEDVAVASYLYPATGLVANLVSVWHQVLTRGSTRRLEVFCEEGVLWTDDDTSGPLRIETSIGVEERECAPPAWVDRLPVPDASRRALGLYAEASRRFLTCVSTGSVASPAAADAVAAHRLVDAAYRSAAGGGAPVAL